MSEAVTPDRLAELRAPIFAAIDRALSAYRCQFTRYADDEDAGYALVDALTPPGDSDITRGQQELELLVDAVCVAISDHVDEMLNEIEHLRKERETLMTLVHGCPKHRSYRGGRKPSTCCAWCEEVYEARKAVTGSG